MPGSAYHLSPVGRLDANLRSGPQMLMYRALARDIASRHSGRVLDWGCGYGQVTALLRDEGVDVTPFDYRAELPKPMVGQLERFPELEAHFSPEPVALPFVDDSFDTVLSC